MEEEMGDLRGTRVDAFLPRLSSEDGMERGKDGVEVSLDCDEEDEEEFDWDSGMGSDDFDLLEVGGESGTEFCQVGDQTCSVPLELYDVSNLSEVLTLDVWNECLSKEEKLGLCKYLPDMDQATFMTTLKDLLSGSNIYFVNPVSRFFNMLKGGLCEPSVSLRRQGLMYFQKQQYYHFLRNYQDSMASDCLQIKDVWSYCNGKSLEDKIKFLNDMRKERKLACENVPNRGFEGDSSGKDAASMDLYFKDDRNARRKNGKLGRSLFLKMNSNGTSFSPSGAARNDDTESDSSDQCDEGAYDYHLKINYVRPGEACGRFADSNVTLHKKRKTGRASLFELATSFKKSFNLSDQLIKVDNCTSKIKRKARNINDFSYHFVRNSDYQCFSQGDTLNSNGLASQSCRLGYNCRSVEFPVEEDDALLKAPGLVEGVGRGRLNKGKNKKTFANYLHENSVAPILRCSSAKEKSKGGKGAKKLGKFNDAQSIFLQPESDATNPIDIQPSDTYAMETGLMNVDPDPTPPRKTFTLITPTVDCSFMFSIIHLLSAVRTALITPYLEDSSGLQHEIQEAKSKTSGDVFNGIHANESMESGNAGLLGQGGVPTFSIQEIVNRVRLNPGDPCILETTEPLLDLVRGVLKIFSSKLAPQGAKGWKPIAKYERSSKSWSWIGPLNRLSDTETMEEVTSPESWGLTHRMLVKLVDAFAIWLKNSQETLRELGGLPPPPASLLQFNIEAKDRLKDLRAQKSLSTISPSTEEVRDYFRREEYLRYSIPDRAFTYTAADGKKSTVAPLRRGGGKPSAKARDHFMLKSDRPPHVTILCLVRDAAARLPGSIGTRADVCTLIRDSQYISEDVTDNQLTQILSGALDRLHYEQDPCVRFEQERKLWVYLHRDRDEEDFDEDGTLSTKKWKKKKKETTDEATATDVVVDEQQTINVVAAAPQLDLISNQSMDVDHNIYESVRDNSEFNGAF